MRGPSPSARLGMTPSGARSFLHHLIAFRVEFGSRFPLRKSLAVRDLITHLKEKLHVFGAAGNVPLWVNLVTRLMVMFRHKLVLLLLAESRRLTDDIPARAGVERRQTHLREFKLVGAIEAAFFRLAVWIHHPAVACGRGPQHVVEVGIAKADVLDVARFSPDAESIH